MYVCMYGRIISRYEIINLYLPEQMYTTRTNTDTTEPFVFLSALRSLSFLTPALFRR